MGVFFGTDGLRGITNDDLSASVAYKCGNSLAAIYPGSKIIIGTDTRKSKDLFALSFSVGAINAGASVCYVGVCPTAGISFLTKFENFDFGVVITASHNPAEFNGIKIFDKNGVKISEKIELAIEKRFLKETILPYDKIGSVEFKPNLVNKYIKFLMRSVTLRLKNTKIVVDLANGSASKVAKKVFKNLGANVIITSSRPNGININDNCGALHITSLAQTVKKHKADVGFAFDGDSDRVIAVDENGNVVDGDQIVYIFAKYFKNKNLLNPSMVVGTRHTNMGIEEDLKKYGIDLIRTEIGDKYVNLKLEELDLIVGGEQSGHVLVKNLLPSGDGILNALLLLKIMNESGEALSNLISKNTYKQCNKNVKVLDKLKVINSEKLAIATELVEKELENSGRIMVRVSGTEPYVRIMVETQDDQKSEKIAEKFVKIIKEIDGEF